MVYKYIIYLNVKIQMKINLNQLLQLLILNLKKVILLMNKVMNLKFVNFILMEH